MDETVILENPNLCKLEDDLDTLINKIHQYQTNANNLNTDIFNLDLENMFSEVNIVSSDLDDLSISINLLCKEDIDKIQNQFGQIKDNLMLSPFKDFIDDAKFKNDLKIVHDNKDIASADSLNNVLTQLKQLYLYDVDNDAILMDIGFFIKNTDDLNNMKNELISSYQNSNQDLRFNDVDRVFKFENKMNNIKNKILTYGAFDINSIEDLQYNLANLVILKGLYVYIISKEDIGNKYFGKYWKSYNSNLNDLITQHNNLIKFNELINSGLISDNTLENLSSFDSSSFSNLSNNMKKLKNDIVEEIKNINNNFKLDFKTIFSSDIDELYAYINSILEDLIVLEKWETFKVSNNNLKLLEYDFGSVQNSLNSLFNYSDDEIFQKISSEINDLDKCLKLKQEIDSQNEIAKTYFSDNWQGYNSDIGVLEKYYSHLIKFNQLVDEGFFAEDIENIISNLNFIDLNHKLGQIESTSENILKDVKYLEKFSFKNLDINSVNLNDLKNQINNILNNFEDIDDWFVFKSKIGFKNIQNLFHYNFLQLDNSIKNISYYFDNNILNDISIEVNDLIRINDLKKQLDSDEFGEKYFKKYWNGSSSDLNDISSHYEKLNRFYALVESKFFTLKTEEAISNLDMVSLNDKISKLSLLKESIFEDFTTLSSLNVFKNNLTNLPIKSIYDKIDFINENLSQIKKWEDYKKEKISLYDKEEDAIYELFDYDFEHVQNSLSNLLINCNFNNDLEKETNTILKLKKIKENIDVDDSNAKKYFGELWSNVNSDIDGLKSFYNDLKNFNKLLKSNFFSKDTLSILDTLNYDELNSIINELEKLNKSINNSFGELNDFLDFNEFLDENNNFNIPIIALNRKFNNLNDHYDDLTKLRSFYSCSKCNNNPYLENIIPLIWEDKVNADCIISLFKFNVANNILNEMVESNHILRNFNEKIFEKNIEKFQNIDKDILHLNQLRIRNILNENKPIVSGKSIRPGSELGILMKEINKKKRNIPIRQLLMDTCNVISRIKPCFMMSPLSVASFLDPKCFNDYFDYVIFDEASQIKTEDVLGIFFRGKNFVIMGDSKQLPPTTFFDSDNDSEDDENSYTEVESILKLCRSVFPDKMLKWHYRSRHESLISVSNFEFYNNDLIVFPSPFNQTDDLGLKLEYNPENYYDRGKSKKNAGEAKDVIEYAINHFKKHGKTKSLGIGTFGITQKEAILEELEFRLRKNPELESYFNETGENGFFIKNLENIQGDERDVILISVGYGFDKDRILKNNFGPLNKNGGERRLNVLITRAREKCVVFCNFLPDDLNVSTSKSRGLKALKSFLYYAKNKEHPMIMEPTGDDFDSPFEKSVHDYLVDMGYSVKKQVGCAGYRIDLAIVDPDNPDKYVLGIECDGATYHSSASARERDRLRQEVLERLGWKFHRIWSTDWFNSRVSAKKRLVDAVDEAIKNKDVPLFVNPPVTMPAPEPIQVPPVKGDDLFENYKFFKDKNNLKNYSQYKPHQIILIEDLIRYEQPIHEEDIYESMRIIQKKNRKTKKFKDSVLNLINSNLNKNTIYRKGNHYYHKSFNINDFTPRKRIKPTLSRISDDEIKLAIINTLKAQYDAPEDELIKCSSKNLGFNKVGDNIRNRFKTLIQELIKEKRIKMNKNGTIGLKND